MKVIVCIFTLFSVGFAAKICDTYQAVVNKKDYTSRIKFRFYNGITTSQYLEMNFAQLKDIVHLSSFDPRKKIMLYTGGYNQSNEDPLTLNILDGYLHRRRYNVILNCWDDFNGVFTAWDIPNDKLNEHIFNIGLLIAHELDQLINRGVSAKTVYLTGFDMGAQIARVIGRHMLYKPRLIVGLDPSEIFKENVFHLDDDAADSVAVLHTRKNSGTNLTNIGVNFFLSNDVNQSGCADVEEFYFCSHFYSLRIWAEVLKNSSSFLARKCKSEEKFVSGLCQKKAIVKLSDDLSFVTNGWYFLKTDSKSPYGLGLMGV